MANTPRRTYWPLAAVVQTGHSRPGCFAAWSEAGNRPTFRLVTGVSVGAIIAPFAFLGPDYDEKLKELATTVSDEKVYRRKELLGSLTSDSVTDTAPFVRLLRQYYNQDVMEAIAAEHAKGRRLYVGTTNLDSGRPVIWDLGAIASSGSPDSLKVFQQVIFASAAIPVAFRPAYIEVEADGQRYDEMHVDGGVTAQAIMYGNAISVAEMRRHIPGVDDPGAPKPTVYVIRNAKFVPEHHTVKPKVIPIAARAVMTLVKAQGLGDVYRLHAVCRRDGLEFRLASIPGDLALPRATQVFDSGQIQRLYRCGYELGRSGDPWTNEPPGLRMSKERRLASAATNHSGFIFISD